MTRRFFSGSTLDQAVMMAARHYEIDPEELAYRQLEKRHGFLRTRKAVMIAVDPDQPRHEVEVAMGDSGPEPAVAAEPEVAVPARATLPDPVEPDPVPSPAPAEEAEPDPVPSPAPAEEVEPDPVPSPAPAEEVEPDPAPSPAPAEEVEPEPASAGWNQPVSEPGESEETRVVAGSPEPAPGGADHDDELLGAAETATQTLMRFAGIDAEASARSSGERVEVEIEGPDSSLLVVEDGNGLLAIQHLLPRMLRGLTGRSSFVRVDSQEFHQQRKERLAALALKEAEAASRSGTPRTLPPMAPDERRIVHLALQDDPTVVTESRGTGLHKRVVVRPVDGDGGSDDIEARHGF